MSKKYGLRIDTQITMAISDTRTEYFDTLEEVRAARDWLSEETWKELCETGHCSDAGAQASLELFRLGA